MYGVRVKTRAVEATPVRGLIAASNELARSGVRASGGRRQRQRVWRFIQPCLAVESTKVLSPCPIGYGYATGSCAPRNQRSRVAFVKKGPCPIGWPHSGAYCLRTSR